MDVIVNKKKGNPELLTDVVETQTSLLPVMGVPFYNFFLLNPDYKVDKYTSPVGKLIGIPLSTIKSLEFRYDSGKCETMTIDEVLEQDDERSKSMMNRILGGR